MRIREWGGGLKSAEIRKFLFQSYLQTVHFDRRVIPHTTVCKHTEIYDVTLPRNKCTFNMAAVTVVNRTAYLSSNVFFWGGGWTHCK